MSVDPIATDDESPAGAAPLPASAPATPPDGAVEPEAGSGGSQGRTAPRRFVSLPDHDGEPMLILVDLVTMIRARESWSGQSLLQAGTASLVVGLPAAETIARFRATGANGHFSADKAAVDAARASAVDAQQLGRDEEPA